MFFVSGSKADPLVELTHRELALAYFRRWQEVILQRLSITQDPATLSDEDRTSLAMAYLGIVSG
jgi:hypothetical protein